MRHWVHTIIEDATSSTKQAPNYLREGYKRIAQLVESLENYAFRTSELEDIAYDICECVELVQLSNLLWQATTATGFQNFSIFVIHQGTEIAFESRICTSYKQAWVERYIEKSYQYSDPVYDRSSKQEGSFLFSELENNCPITQLYWDDAERHQVGKNGVCFSLTRRQGVRLAVSFSTSNSVGKTKEMARLNGSDLEAIAFLAADCFCNITFGSELSDETLSSQELRFLYKLATSHNPNDALGISNLYGGNHSLQSSIKEKLNVKSVFQAVSLASSKGWFNHVPYSACDVTRSYPALTWPNEELLKEGYERE